MKHHALRVISLLVAARLSAQTPVTDVSHKVEEIFAKAIAPDGAGCAVSVSQAGRLVLQRGYGKANLSHGVAITPDTRFHVASLSKQFTAMAIAILAGQGKLRFEDPVRHYLPEPRIFQDYGITILDLIHHTSGLREQWSMLGLAGWRLDDEDAVLDTDVLNLIEHMSELDFLPGTRHSYSNTNYTILAKIVEKVSGVSFREFTTKAIFEPLGMRSTFFRSNHHEIVPNMATGYRPAKSGGFEESSPRFNTVGATGLITTAADMARWDTNFNQQRLLPPDLAARIVIPRQLGNGDNTGYAFGMRVGSYKGMGLLEHGGGDAGYRASYLRFPTERFGVTCLCNRIVNSHSLAAQVAELYLAGRLKDPPQPTSETAVNSAPVEVKKEDLGRLVGVYHEADREEVMRFEVREPALWMLGFGEVRRLIPTGAQTFDMEGRPARLIFEENAVVLYIRGEKSGRFTRKRDFPNTELAFTAFPGRYYSAELDATFTIVRGKDGLLVERRKNPSLAMQPMFFDHFRARGLGAFHFEREQNGAVVAFRFTDHNVRGVLFKRLP